MVLIGRRRRKQLRSLQRAGRADAEGGKGERVWKNATRMPTVFGSVLKKIILIENDNNLKKRSSSLVFQAAAGSVGATLEGSTPLS